MKIGYPCINTKLNVCVNKTFRLRSYSEERFIKTVENNLDALLCILKYNVDYGLRFFRISSDIIPFASHEVLTVDWRSAFKIKLEVLGAFINKHDIRISMHPDQFIVLNSPRDSVVENSIKELQYHADFLETLSLNTAHKIQLHGGGVYGDKFAALKRFGQNFQKLSNAVKKRLVIENDERSYSLQDCLLLNSEIGIPILFDVLHFECFNNGESLVDAMKYAFATWKTADGRPMIDYSSQAFGGRTGKHNQTLDVNHFTQFIQKTASLDFDIMLEIKDKQESAIKALELVKRIRNIE